MAGADEKNFLRDVVKPAKRCDRKSNGESVVVICVVISDTIEMKNGINTSEILPVFQVEQKLDYRVCSAKIRSRHRFGLPVNVKLRSANILSDDDENKNPPTADSLEQKRIRDPLKKYRDFSF